MRALGILCLAAAWILLPASASAAPDGVVVDPDSPSGKEYAIPLDQAVQASGATGSRSADGQPSSQAAPLFGRGLSLSARARSADPSRDRLTAGGSKGRERAAGAGHASRPGSPRSDPAVTAAAGREQGSDISRQLTVGIPLAALIVGTGLVVFVRRRNRPE